MGFKGKDRDNPWLPAWDDERPALGFLALFGPELAQACEALMAAGLAREDIAAMRACLSPRLLNVVVRTLVVEVNVARVKGELRGADSGARFLSFLDQLRTERRRAAIFGEFPVLASLGRQVISQWRCHTERLLSRLAADRVALRAFGVGPASGLVRVDGAGDAHAGGQQACILAFADGGKVLYKPRPMAVDRAVGELCDWLAASGAPERLRTPRVIDRGGFGWMEFVPASACADAGELASFHRRLGAWLAVFYAFGARDFHFENLVASGPEPVPVDLETFLHPRVAARHCEDAAALARDRMLDSVLQSGLLPSPRRVKGRSVDVSGIGGDVGQGSLYQVPALRLSGTDEIRLVRVDDRIRSVVNRPTLAGRPTKLADFAGPLAEGFRSTYQWLASRRDALLAPAGPLARFRAVDVRVVVRPTMAYLPVLVESYHPHLLRAPGDRERLIGGLAAAAAASPHLAPFVRSEARQIVDGDIPCFVARADGRGVVGGGRDALAAALHEDALAVAEGRIRRLGAADLKLQSWLLHASVAAAADAAGDQVTLVHPSATAASGDDPLRLARRIGDELVRGAFRRGSEVGWLTLGFVPDPADRRVGTYRIQVAGDDLYAGRAGVCLFLAYLGWATGERRFTAVAEEAASGIRPVPGLGAFSGAAGHTYLWTHLGALWSRAALLDRAEETLAVLAERIPESTNPDVIGGLAGVIPCLLGLHTVRSSGAALTVAQRCGRTLASLGTPRPGGGAAWEALPAKLGFSHGHAGVAWSLALLAEATGDAELRAAAVAAATWEESLLPTVGWTDAGEPGRDAQSTWCHGAAGIALSRSVLWRLSDEDWARNARDRALTRMLQTPAPANHSLCHGALGNLELLGQVVAGEPSTGPWRRYLAEQTSTVLGTLAASGSACATPGAVPAPGLMTGLAGIGLALLRLARPDAVPSVLALAGPGRHFVA